MGALPDGCSVNLDAGNGKLLAGDHLATQGLTLRTGPQTTIGRIVLGAAGMAPRPGGNANDMKGGKPRLEESLSPIPRGSVDHDAVGEDAG